MKGLIKKLVFGAYIRLYSSTHKCRNIVSFSSFGGRQYSDNPRAVSEKLHELYPNYEIEWYFSDKFDNYDIVPDYVRIRKGTIWEYLKVVASSVCNVTNEAYSSWVQKNDDQFFVQLWHGDRGLKKIGYDSANIDNRHKLSEDRLADFCTAGSDFMAGVFRTAFDYHGEIMNMGIPRNDKLINYDLRERKAVRDKLSIRDNEKLLLYAPTYRQHGTETKKSVIDLDETLEHLEGKGEKWICAVRAHSSSGGLDSEKYVDLTSYPDMADLLLAADMLITDYSSCAGDFILTDKPVILAHFDREEYLKSSRTFYFDPDESGYIIAKDQDELNDIIDNCTREDYIKSNIRVSKFYGVTESGRASEEVCRRIDKFIRTGIRTH